MGERRTSRCSSRPTPMLPTSRGGQVPRPPPQEARQGKAWGREPTGEGPASPAAPAASMQGPTWGGVRARSGHRVVQRRQLALHAAEALGKAGLLPLQHLLQLADGREELLFVETVLGREGVSTATSVAALSSQQPPRPLGPPMAPQPHQAPRHPGLSQVTGQTLPRAHRSERQLASQQKQSSCFSESRAEPRILSHWVIQQFIPPKVTYHQSVPSKDSLILRSESVL